jgi:hypothetical protein
MKRQWPWRQELNIFYLFGMGRPKKKNLQSHRQKGIFLPVGRRFNIEKPLSGRCFIGTEKYRKRL